MKYSIPVAKANIFKKKLIVFFVLLFTILLIIFVFGAKRSYKNANETNSSQSTQNSENQKEIGDFYIQIEKLQVEAPILRGVDPTNQEKYDEALKYGVAHMVGTALPGSNKGNIFIYGHSSADSNNKYGKIFAHLNNLDLSRSRHIVNTLVM